MMRMHLIALVSAFSIFACSRFTGEHALLGLLADGITLQTVGAPNDYEAFWRFDDLSDASGHGHALNDRGVDVATNRMGVLGKAYDFRYDGLEVSSAGELNFTNELSISLWFNTTDDVSDQKLISKINGGFGYVLGIQNGELYPEVFDSISFRYWYNDGACPVVSNQWYHVVMTWKTGGYLKTYLNGSLDKAIPVGAFPIGGDNLNEFMIGDGSWAIGNFRVQGRIDDVRIYGRELNAAEVLQLYGLPAD